MVLRFFVIRCICIHLIPPSMFHACMTSFSKHRFFSFFFFLFSFFFFWWKKKKNMYSICLNWVLLSHGCFVLKMSDFPVPNIVKDFIIGNKGLSCWWYTIGCLQRIIINTYILFYVKIIFLFSFFICFIA